MWETMPAVPMLVYADAPAAIEFLCRAFGFRVAYRMDGANGSIGHAELHLGDGVVMLATAWPEAGFRSPSELDGVHSQVWCEVDDVDAHSTVAHAAGAVVIGPPADQDFGFRTYRAIDPEGHRWYFASRIQ
jgi:uncharacterized glyoxalase superfamily protein PhnB